MPAATALVTASDWIVARTKPNREKWAAENLAQQKYEHYLPMIPVMQKGANGLGKAVAEPLFRSYIFVKAIRWHAVLSTFGIASVVMAGERPAFIREKDIQAIKEREGDGGLVLLPKPVPQLLKPGMRVRVKNGPFMNHRGIHVGSEPKDRERVLMDYLGGKTNFLFKTVDLEPE